MIALCILSIFEGIAIDATYGSPNVKLVWSEGRAPENGASTLQYNATFIGYNATELDTMPRSWSGLPRMDIWRFLLNLILADTR